MLKDKFIKKFLGSAGLSFSLRLSWAVLNYAVLVCLARWLTGDDYGLYGMIMSALILMGIVCGLGAQTTIIRFIGQYKSEGNPSLENGIRRYAYSRVLGASLVVTALSLVIIWTGSTLGYIERPIIYSIGSLLLPAFSLVDVQSGAARAYGSVMVALAPRDVFWRAGLLVFGFIATRFLPQTQQLLAILILGFVSLTLLSYWQHRAVERLIPQTVKGANEERNLKQWHSVMLPIWVTGVFSVAMKTIDTLSLSFTLPLEQVGWYFAASRIATLVSFIMTAINIVIGPEIAQLYYAKNYDQLRRILKIGAIAVFLPSFFVFILCVVFASPILGYLFGPDFRQMRPELIILATGQMISAAVGCVGVMMKMTNQQKKEAEIYVSTGVVTSIATFFAAYFYGSLGVAITVSVGTTIWNLRMWWHVRSKSGFDPSILGVLFPLRQKSN